VRISRVGKRLVMFLASTSDDEVFNERDPRLDNGEVQPSSRPNKARE
jgi:hypothetical protein